MGVIHTVTARIGNKAIRLLPWKTVSNFACYGFARTPQPQQFDPYNLLELTFGGKATCS